MTQELSLSLYIYISLSLSLSRNLGHWPLCVLLTELQQALCHVAKEAGEDQQPHHDDKYSVEAFLGVGRILSSNLAFRVLRGGGDFISHWNNRQIWAPKSLPISFSLYFSREEQIY